MKFTGIEEVGVPKEVRDDWDELRRLSASLRDLAPEEIMQVTGRMAGIRERIEAAGYSLNDLLTTEGTENTEKKRNNGI